jgi:hypothetical protein
MRSDSGSAEPAAPHFAAVAGSPGGFRLCHRGPYCSPGVIAYCAELGAARAPLRFTAAVAATAAAAAAKTRHTLRNTRAGVLS